MILSFMMLLRGKVCKTSDVHCKWNPSLQHIAALDLIISNDILIQQQISRIYEPVILRNGDLTSI